MSINTTNQAILEFLGLSGQTGISAINIRVRPHSYPAVTIQRIIVESKELKQTSAKFILKKVEDDHDADPSA